MDSTSSFGYWLRRRRKALDLTQDELARRVGCALDTIKKLEADARRPSRQLAERLVDCLQLASEERIAFLQAARGERAPDRLAIPNRPVDHAVDQTQPAPFLTAEPEQAGSDHTVFVGRERELAWLDD